MLPHHLTNLLVVDRSRPLEAGMPFMHEDRQNTWTHAWPVTIDITLPRGGLDMAALGYKHLQGIWGESMFRDSEQSKVDKRVRAALRRSLLDIFENTEVTVTA